MITFFRQMLILVCLFCFSIPTGFADTVKPTTKIKHKPLAYFVPEHRILVEAEAMDESGISVMRCYFRSVREADFVFVEMKSGSAFKGILPAPAKEAEAIEYLFLAVNGKNQVVKTDRFVMKNNPTASVPEWQKVPSEGYVVVSTELGQAPKQLSGFKDSITWDIVESSARFGAVAGGIYAAAGSTSGAAATATSAGTIATTTGISTPTAVGIGAGVGAAVLIGAAAADSGGGGGCDPPKIVSATDSVVYGGYIELKAEGCAPFKWTSSNESVATIYVDPNNTQTVRLNAVNVGDTVVTVTDSEGTKSSPKSFKVIPNVVIQ